MFSARHKRDAEMREVAAHAGALRHGVVRRGAGVRAAAHVLDVVVNPVGDREHFIVRFLDLAEQVPGEPAAGGRIGSSGSGRDTVIGACSSSAATGRVRDAGRRRAPRSRTPPSRAYFSRREPLGACPCPRRMNRLPKLVRVLAHRHARLDLEAVRREPSARRCAARCMLNESVAERKLHRVFELC